MFIVYEDPTDMAFMRHDIKHAIFENNTEADAVNLVGAMDEIYINTNRLLLMNAICSLFLLLISSYKTWHSLFPKKEDKKNV
tara:strand:- start:845 stop:1090 length:246 start_codon:yes stop_codon:yes gene_type:complete